MNSRTIELDPERWSRVENLFERAVNLESGEHRAFLDAACSGDEELRDYVFALLQSNPAQEASIEKTIVDTMSRAFGDDDSSADQMKGEMIGPYRVERLLGSGGMGMVYLAERADQQFDQQVAIKLGRHRLVDPDTVLRLRSERQILADLDHPNIARLFDGGTTDDGVPYLVMEHIDGVRIDTYCDLHRLTIVDRLRIFQTICSAVDYAHQNLIIHRDIKASNILVTSDGNPKLLDFGIAKLVDSAGEATDGLTREGAVIMTPVNATPEQIMGRSVTTATDVYALGLLLHSLLSGFRAYETGDLTPTEFARIICQQDTIRPSLRLEQQKQTAQRDRDPGSLHEFEQIGRDRGTNSIRLQRQLRGDLDTIILNALRKEPERRYRSAGALANDIGLHLRSMPIDARADSIRYRAGKFIRRHYAAVSMATLVVAMLVGFTVMLSVQNRNIAQERDTAREVSLFLEDIFMTPDPARARGADITAEEILAAGASRIRSDLDGRPEIQAALMGTIGRVYYNLGVYQPSVEMLEQALQLRQRTDGDAHPSVAAAMNDLAEVLIRRAEYQRATELLQGALVINQPEHGDTSPQVATNFFNLAEVYLATSELDLAEAFAESSIEIYAQLDEQYGIEFAEAKSTLARILQVRGDLDKTELLLREAIEIVTGTQGPDHPLMAYYLQNLGVLQRSKGDLDAAEITLQKAVDATRRILGDKHDLLAMTLVSQGTLLHARGDYDTAEQVMRDALSLHIETRGTDHPLVAYDMTALGMLLHDMSDLETAEDMLRNALIIQDRVLDDKHQYTASTLTELGAVLNTRGYLAEAESLLERALEIRLDGYPPEHELVAATRAEYADTLTRLGFFDEAELLLLKSVDALSNKPGRRQRRALEALARHHELAGRLNTESIGP